jgi:methyl-accepting chemotaxis protein
MSIKLKLILFPLLFIFLIFVLGVIFSYYNNVAKEKNYLALESEDLVQNLLKSRITVYQFLQTSNENTAQVVKNNFENFINEISHLKTLLVTQENKKASDTIVTLSKEYLVAFDKLAQYKIEEVKNSDTAQSVEIKSLISTMVQLGSEIDEKLHHISEKASQDRESFGHCTYCNRFVCSSVFYYYTGSFKYHYFLSKRTVLFF